MVRILVILGSSPFKFSGLFISGNVEGEGILSLPTTFIAFAISFAFNSMAGFLVFNAMEAFILLAGVVDPSLLFFKVEEKGKSLLERENGACWLPPPKLLPLLLLLLLIPIPIFPMLFLLIFRPIPIPMPGTPIPGIPIPPRLTKKGLP